MSIVSAVGTGNQSLSKIFNPGDKAVVKFPEDHKADVRNGKVVTIVSHHTDVDAYHVDFGGFYDCFWTKYLFPFEETVSPIPFENCVCDIIALMRFGCKCGHLDYVKSKEPNGSAQNNNDTAGSWSHL